MAKNKKIRNIALLTGGGDCPGLNAVIRAITKTAINKHKMNVFGIEDGYLGLIENRISPLTYKAASSIINVGGTILGSCNKANPFDYPVEDADGNKTRRDISDKCLANLEENRIDALICIGGDGTMNSAADFAKKGITVMGVPKTIDNDLWGTDVTFGFDTAVTTATEALDKLHTTASSHHRVMVAEVMGRYAGWIALHAGMASGSDVILIPEIPYELDKICEFVDDRSKVGKRFSIVVIAEGARLKGGQMHISKSVEDSPDPIRLGGVANILADKIQKMTAIETRAAILGHIQRGGTPTSRDRILGTTFGFMAVDMLAKGEKNQLVVQKDGNFDSIPLYRVRGKIKTVKKNSPYIRAAKAVKTCMGV